jgi:hypothetical protein
MGFHWGDDASNCGVGFSIFLCGCKQPKSIHIVFRPQRYGLFLERPNFFAIKNGWAYKKHKSDDPHGQSLDKIIYLIN